MALTAIEQQIDYLDRQVLKLARQDAQIRRSMYHRTLLEGGADASPQRHELRAIVSNGARLASRAFETAGTLTAHPH
jgi:hypothetical protein